MALITVSILLFILLHPPIFLSSLTKAADQAKDCMELPKNLW